jgi:hypothetical protein
MTLHTGGFIGAWKVAPKNKERSVFIDDAVTGVTGDMRAMHAALHRGNAPRARSAVKKFRGKVAVAMTSGAFPRSVMQGGFFGGIECVLDLGMTEITLDLVFCYMVFMDENRVVEP